MRQLPQRRHGYGQVAQAFRHDPALRDMSSDCDVDAGNLPAHLAGLCEPRRGAQLRDAVAGDVRQAAELLETGLASLSRGTQAGGRNGSA